FGIDEYFDGQSICLVEWPERGGSLLPSADLTITLHASSARARTVTLEAGSAAGEKMMQQVQ
ncbi:MAG: tRNA (adenosine(37)-N6)-threonylcarbamoyltransferase complex ATPase subunit type 1 TsaE, partial [Gammaproteobacteria bacterium]